MPHNGHLVIIPKQVSYYAQKENAVCNVDVALGPHRCLCFSLGFFQTEEKVYFFGFVFWSDIYALMILNI